MTIAGPPSPHQVDRALCLLRGEWVGGRATLWLDPALFLAEAWSPGRLARCRRHLANGEAAPPVRAIRHELPGRVFYSLGDGNHRVVAALERGQPVLAQIDGCYRIELGRFLVDGRALLRRDDRGWDILEHDLDDEQLLGLALAGVSISSCGILAARLAAGPRSGRAPLLEA